MTPDFMFTIAGQKYQANIASIAQSLRVIAEELSKANKQKEVQHGEEES